MSIYEKTFNFTFLTTYTDLITSLIITDISLSLKPGA